MGRHSERRKIKNKKRIKKRIIIFLSLIVLLVVIGILKVNKNNQEIIGLWNADGNTKYEFLDNGNGYLKVPIKELKFTYSIQDNMLSIDFENEESEDVNYEYEINDNKLILKNKYGIFEFYKENKQY